MVRVCFFNDLLAALHVAHLLSFFYKSEAIGLTHDNEVITFFFVEVQLDSELSRRKVVVVHDVVDNVPIVQFWLEDGLAGGAELSDLGGLVAGLAHVLESRLHKELGAVFVVFAN